jgi:hypothetical protein
MRRSCFRRAVHLSDATPRKVWHLFATEFFGWCLDGAGHWVIERRDGTMGVTGISHPSYYPEPEMGWALYDGFEGLGYATEAAAAARDWAKGALPHWSATPMQQHALRRRGRTPRRGARPGRPCPTDVDRRAGLSRLPPLGRA